MKNKRAEMEQEALSRAMDNLYNVLDNWMALRRQIERDAMESPRGLFDPTPDTNPFDNADELCTTALYQVLSVAGWQPRIWNRADLSDESHERK